jgi:hypothetical protein
VANKRHLFHHPLIRFVDAPIHFHLHWMYGKKVETFFKQKGIVNKHEIVAQQAENKYSPLLSSLFWEKRSQWVNT